MGKRGPKPKGRVRIEWSADFAYAVGLVASDGSLSKDGRHISFVSKDFEQVNNFKGALCVHDLKITVHLDSRHNKAFRAQFSDVLFYRFLESIGLHTNKSLTLGGLDMPDEYFFDFLRGFFDGDGSIYSYLDKRWKNSFMFYVSFTSASLAFIDWLRINIKNKAGVVGHIKKHLRGNQCFDLSYAKRESFIIINKMYPTADVRCLSRKKLKIMSILSMMGQPQKSGSNTGAQVS